MTSYKPRAMVLPLLGLFLLLFLTDGCPNENLPPCSCKQTENRASELTCSHVEYERDLVDSINSLRSSQPVSSVTIEDAALLYIPSDLFRDMPIEKLRLVGSSFMSLTETDVAFEGLENSLQQLVVVGCMLLNGWQWSQLRNLASLVEIYTAASGLTYVDSDIGHLADLNVSNLELTRDSISLIHDTAFESFSKLRLLSLARNEISTVKGSMFPKELVHLILSHNRLESLPENLFVNMPEVSSVVLVGNRLMEVQENTFAPVWNQLIHLNLQGNPLVCDCKMKWMLSHEYLWNFDIECSYPVVLKHSQLKTLHADDLVC